MLNRSRKSIEKDLDQLLEKAKTVNNYVEVQQALQRLKEIKASVKKKKHSKDDSQGDQTLLAMHQCEKAIDDRLRKIRIGHKSPNHVPRAVKNHISKSSSAENVKTVQNDNKTIHRLKKSLREEKDVTKYLRQKLSCTEEEVANKQQTIGDLREQLHLAESNLMHKILKHQEKPQLPNNPRFFKIDAEQENHKNLLREKQRIVTQYEERLTSKNQLISRLKQDVAQLQTDLNLVRQQSKLNTQAYIKERDSLRRMIDSLTLKLEASIREKDDLRRQNQQFRHQSGLFGEEVQKLLSQKHLFRQTLERNYTILKEELLRKERQLQQKTTVSSEPEKAKKDDEAEKQLMKLQIKLIQSEYKVKALTEELGQTKAKVCDWEDKYSQRKAKYEDLKRQLERVKSDTVLKQAILNRTQSQDRLKKTEDLRDASRSIDRRVKALENIKSMIRRFPH